MNVPLNDYLGSNLTRPLPTAVMTDLASVFASARANGIKIVLRFQYNQGATYNATNGTSLDPDSTKAAMLQHIDQVAPTLQDNADVLAVMEAGFIGEWGEWHDSGTSGLIPKRDVWLADPVNASSTREVMNALLAAVPSNRMVQMRCPHPEGRPVLHGRHPDEPCGGVHREREGARRPPQRLLSFLLQRRVDLSGRSGLDRAVEVLRRTGHAVHSLRRRDLRPGPAQQLLGRGAREPQAAPQLAEPRVLQGRVHHMEVPGLQDTISRGMSYRLAMTTAVLLGAGLHRDAAGGLLVATLRNDGFASMYNARPVFLVLSSGAHRYPFQLDADPRWWQPGQTYTLSASLPMSWGSPRGPTPWRCGCPMRRRPSRSPPRVLGAVRERQVLGSGQRLERRGQRRRFPVS